MKNCYHYEAELVGTREDRDVISNLMPDRAYVKYYPRIGIDGCDWSYIAVVTDGTYRSCEDVKKRVRRAVRGLGIKVIFEQIVKAKLGVYEAK